jgi:hypothetical protein
VSAPRSVKFNEDILLLVYNLVEVLSYEDGDGSIVIFRKRLGLHVGFIRIILGSSDECRKGLGVKRLVLFLVPDDERRRGSTVLDIDYGRDNISGRSPSAGNSDLFRRSNYESSLVGLGNLEGSLGRVGIILFVEDSEQVKSGNLSTSPTLLRKFVNKRESLRENPGGKIVGVEGAIVDLGFFSILVELYGSFLLISEERSVIDVGKGKSLEFIALGGVQPGSLVITSYVSENTSSTSSSNGVNIGLGGKSLGRRS